jgi:HSP20 family molecular chaperone IbpA
MHRSSARKGSRHRFPAYWFDKIAGKDKEVDVKQSSPRVPVRISRNEQSVVVTLDVNGYTPPELMVSHYDGELVVAGAKKKTSNWWSKSKQEGRFTKYVDINEGVDWDRAEAELENGELRITLPREGEA